MFPPRFIERELLPSEMREKIYIFNTYFMDKLCPYDKVSMIQNNDAQKLGELFLKCYDNIKKVYILWSTTCAFCVSGSRKISSARTICFSR